MEIEGSLQTWQSHNEGESFPSSFCYLAHLSREAGSIQTQAVPSALILEKPSQEIGIKTPTIERKEEK